MKNSILLIIALLATHWGLSQSHTAKFSNASGEKKIKIIMSKGDINLGVHDSPEVVISTNDYEEPPERARGLRPLYNSATDNTGIGLEVSESNNAMTIKKATNNDMDFTIKVPKNVAIHIDQRGWESGDVTIEGVQGELEVECHSADIKIKNAPGPIVANTVNGNIEVVYSSLNQDSPSSISCTNGFIDVTMPGSSKADVKLRSINGEIYTDMDIDMGKSKDGMHRVGGRNISGTINGGGVEISLRTINSEIYLRKAK